MGTFLQFFMEDFSVFCGLFSSMSTLPRWTRGKVEREGGDAILKYRKERLERTFGGNF